MAKFVLLGTILERGMSKLPETGYLRLNQILGNKKTNPPTPPLIPISKSTWWEGIKTGRFPKSVKLEARITVWHVEDIRRLINNGLENKHD